MEKTTKKIIAFIVGVTFAAAIFVALAWGTSGFRNWNAAMWFDCWGKGTPQEVSKTEHEKPEANGGMRKTAAHAGVVNDSDDSELTVTVQRYSSPSFMFLDNKVSILGGTHGDILRFDFNNGEYVRDFDYANATGNNNNKFELTYAEWAELWQAYGSTSAFLNVYNVGNDDYMNSVGYTVSSNILPRGFTFGANDSVCYISPITPYFDGVKVIVPIPENAPANFGYAVKIGKSYAYSSGLEYYNYDGQADSAAVTVYDDRYEINLSLLSFVNSPQPVNHVYICPIRPTAYSNSKYNVLSKEYELNFSITKLAAPTNLRLNGNELAWDAVDGAEGYLFSCNGSTIDGTVVDEPKIQLDDLTPGEYTFRVRALGNVGTNLARMGKATAFNANSVITQVVTLTYNVDGDTVTKFVPLGKSVGDYLYDVAVDGREFGGWYYDSGFSSAVNSRDKLENDTTIYARLSDKPVTERPLTWWERNMWYVLAPCIAVVVLALLVGVGIAIKKRKSA